MALVTPANKHAMCGRCKQKCAHIVLQEQDLKLCSCDGCHQIFLLSKVDGKEITTRFRGRWAPLQLKPGLIRREIMSELVAQRQAELEESERLRRQDLRAKLLGNAQRDLLRFTRPKALEVLDRHEVRGDWVGSLAETLTTIVAGSAMEAALSKPADPPKVESVPGFRHLLEMGKQGRQLAESLLEEVLEAVKDEGARIGRRLGKELPK